MVVSEIETKTLADCIRRATAAENRNQVQLTQLLALDS